MCRECRPIRSAVFARSSKAAIDGASTWQTLRGIVLPLVWPVLLASAILVTILSMTEVGATVLLFEHDRRSLGRPAQVAAHQLGGFGELGLSRPCEHEHGVQRPAITAMVT